MTEIVVFAPDLMDRSRISAALPHAQFVAAADQLHDAAPGALLLVDLHRPGVLAAIPALRQTVIGFASHVDDSLLQAARDAGCAEVLPRSRFFRRLAELGGETGQTGDE
jgi:hypothetical protein